MDKMYNQNTKTTKDNSILFDLFKDKNVNFLRERKEVNVCSYDRALIDEPEYVKEILNKIIDKKEEINNFFQSYYFVISIDGYAIDGLYESNSLLVSKQSVIYPIY